MRLVTNLRRRLPSDYSVKARLIAFAAAATYALLLWYNYKTYIHPAFNYMNFVFFKHSPVAVAGDTLLAALPALFLPLTIRRPSDLALMLLYVIAYIPSEMFTTSVVTVVTSSILALKVTLLLTMAVILWIAGGNQMRPSLFISFKRNIFMLGLLALAVACVGLMGMTYGFRITLHNFADVYGQRDAFKAELQDAGYATYVVQLLNNVLAPTMISYGLLFRRPQFVVIGMMLSLYVFSITGLKSSVMAIVYTISLFTGMTLIRKNILIFIIFGIISICSLGIFIDSAHIPSTVNSLIVRRTFVMPGVLTAYYQDYYQHNPFLYLSQSVLSPFLKSPQSMSPDDLIGQIYFNGGEHANASLFSDGFAQAGLVGVLLSGVIAGLFLRTVNYCLSRMDLKLACCSISMVFFMMTQTGIIKILGTHGGIAACLLFLLTDMRRDAARTRRDALGRIVSPPRDAAGAGT